MAMRLTVTRKKKKYIEMFILNLFYTFIDKEKGEYYIAEYLICGVLLKQNYPHD